MATIPTVSKIMIIRHAEKPPENNDPAGVLLDGSPDHEALIVQGWQRAGGLAAMFDPSRLLQSSELVAPRPLLLRGRLTRRGASVLMRPSVPWR